MITTIIFDFGGVLGTNDDDIFFETLKKYGISKIQADKLWEQFWPEIKLGKIPDTALWEEVEQYATTNAETLAKDYARRIHIYDNMRKLCENLSHHYKLGILANAGNEWMDIKRKKGHLDELFDTITASAYIGIAKPNAEAYQHILASLQAQPHETLFIDNMSRNTDAAEKLNINTILFTTYDALCKALKKHNITI
jgi:HAD superfamily hydrolase (TIGR01509 family)